MEYGPDLIIDLKRKYGELYEVAIGSTKIIFRALTFKEFNELSIAEDYTNSAESEELIVKEALLHPEFDELLKLSAGIISTLAQEIIDESCFFDIAKGRDIINAERENANDIRILMKAFIISAMPAYRMEELEDQTFAQLATKLVLAEEILEIRFHTQKSVFHEGGEAPTLILVDPEEEADEAEREASKHNLSRPDGAAVANDPVAERLHTAFG